MKFTGTISLAALLAGIAVAPLHAADSRPTVLDKVKWGVGPCAGRLGSVAEIQVPDGYIFAGADDTRLLMEAMRNPTSGSELGFFAPKAMNWFLVFEFDETGYIKDDEKDSLDANAMLDSIQKGNEAGNREREKRGWPPLKIIGWEQPPRYNPETHNLEWAIRGEAQGESVVNFNTRLLGREGVMKVTLVTAPTELPATMPKFRDAIGLFTFTQGHRYAEFRQGDKIAKYGLSALIVGGATAVAVKTGLFKWLWKGIVIGAIALSGFFKRIFSRNKNTAVPPPS